MGSSSESESDFSSAITRVAVAQICQSVGYGAAQASALDILSDVAARYIKAIAKSAVASTNSGGRSQSNLIDIVIALEDLGSVPGFKGASSTFITPTQFSLISSSSLLKEIMKFISYTDEIPFAQPLMRRSLHWMRKCEVDSIRKRIDDDNYGVNNLRHVPRWLPEMPVLIGKEMEEEKGEENLRWGFGTGGEDEIIAEGEGERKGKGKGKAKGFELPEKRGKVRFKIGVGGGGWAEEMRSGGVFTRGGIGKRVLCHNWSGGSKDDRKMMRTAVMPR